MMPKPGCNIKLWPRNRTYRCQACTSKSCFYNRANTCTVPMLLLYGTPYRCPLLRPGHCPVLQPGKCPLLQHGHCHLQRHVYCSASGQLCCSMVTVLCCGRFTVLHQGHCAAQWTGHCPEHWTGCCPDMQKDCPYLWWSDRSTWYRHLQPDALRWRCSNSFWYQ